MTLIEILLSALGFLLKGIFFLVILGLALLIWIICRETAWYIREKNKRELEKQEEKKK